MAYTINRFDRSILTQVIDGTLDRTTDLKLVGKNYVSYGEVQNENFLFLLENFSGTSEPARPLSGQLWYNTDGSRLKIYNGNKWESLALLELSNEAPLQVKGSLWKPANDNTLKFFDGTRHRNLGILEESAQEPAQSDIGNLWWNTNAGQLYTYNGSEWELIGPQKAGNNITRLVSEVITDNNDNDNPVVVSYVNGERVFIISDSEFTLDDSTPIQGFDVIKKGITLVNSTDEKGITDTDSEYWFWGTASNANYLDGITSSQFLRSDEDTALQGNLQLVDNNTGLEWNESAVTVKNQNDKLEFSVPDSGEFLFYYNDFGSKNQLLKIDTQEGVNGLTFRNNTVWHAGNQGSGTGLDADTLDGFEASDFLQANAKAVDSDLLDGFDSTDFVRSAGDKITGNLEIQGDKLGVLWNANSFNSAAIRFYTNDNTESRLEYQITDDNNEFFTWKAYNASFTSSIELLKLDTVDTINGLKFRGNTVWHEGNQGPGTGLNADTLDGVEATGFLPIDGKAVDADRADRTPLADRAIQADNAGTLEGFNQSVFYRKTGGPVSDFVTLHAAPVNDFHAATKKYVDDEVDRLEDLINEDPLWAGATTLSNVVATYSSFPVGTRVSFWDERNYSRPANSNGGSVHISDRYRRTVKKAGPSSWVDIGG